MGKLAAAFYPTLHATRGTRRFSGNFTTNNVTDPVASSSVGAAFVVTRTGVGRFLITFNSSVRAVLYADANAVAVNRLCVIQAASAGTNRLGASMTVEVQSALGTAVETTGLVVMFEADIQLVRNHRGNS